ncbi:MAG TPA: FecR family protein [Candidatus Acidoferrum sp.]|jgi:hypothetical protein
MNAKSPYAFCLALLSSCLILAPTDSYAAAPQAAGAQRAGEVSRVIPAVSIARESKTVAASTKTIVDWQDVVNTEAAGRARVSLDDGSVLNVGSTSSMRVVKHDAGAQQTQLEITYGKLRTQAQKIARPDGKFEVHTPAGVAGVVGTDFFVSYENGVMNVITFEGLVRVCNLANVCVIVKAGQMSSIRNGDNSGPTPPTQATLNELMETANSTNITGPGAGVETAGIAAAHHGLIGGLIGLGIVGAVAAIAAPLATRGGPPPQAPIKVINQCPNPRACG